MSESSRALRIVFLRPWSSADNSRTRAGVGMHRALDLNYDRHIICPVRAGPRAIVASEGSPSSARPTGRLMRYAAGQKEKTRARILEAAARVFRRQGYHAAGVDQVMQEAGLTAGGFYAHFESKQALLAEALTHAGVEAGRRRDEGLEDLSGREWVEAFLARYLDMSHRGRVEDGCPLVALVSEVSRADAPVKKRFETMVRELEVSLSAHASPCEPGAAEGRAFAAVALCVGGLGLARSVQDEALAERILASCREQARNILCGEPDSPGRPRPRRRRDPS